MPIFYSLKGSAYVEDASAVSTIIISDFGTLTLSFHDWVNDATNVENQIITIINNAPLQSDATATVSGIGDTVYYDISYVFDDSLGLDDSGRTFAIGFPYYDGYKHFWIKVLPNVDANCPSCNEITREACQSSYSLTTGLTANTQYIVVISDRVGREYYQTVTTDGSGNLTIDYTLMPGDFTTPYNSPQQVVVKATIDGEPLTITDGASTYPCININYVYREDTTPTP